MTTLFLVPRIKISRVLSIRFLPRDVAFGGTLFDLGFMVVSGWCAAMFHKLGLSLSRNGTDAFSCWVVDLALYHMQEERRRGR